jgi:hypothetical protein
VTSTFAHARKLTSNQKPKSIQSPEAKKRETGKAALFTQREAAVQDANELLGKWSFGFYRSGHSSLFHPRTPVCRSQRPSLPPPPPHAALRLGGPSQTLLPFLERCPWLHLLCFGGRGGIPPTSPAYCPARRAILHPLSGQERLLHRSRGRSSLPQGGNRGSSTLFSASMLHQFHLSRSEKERRDAPNIEFEEFEHGAPEHTLLPHGDSRGCPPCPQVGGLGGIHRPMRRLLSCPPPPLHEEIHVLQVERPPLSLLCPPLRPIPSSEGLHSSDQVHQGAFPARALGAGWPAANIPLFSVLGRPGDPYLFISSFSSPFRPVGHLRGESALLFPVVL